MEHDLDFKIGVITDSILSLGLYQHDLYLSYREAIKLHIGRDNVLKDVIENEDDYYRKRVGVICEHYKREGYLKKPTLNPGFDRQVEDLVDSMVGFGIFDINCSMYTTRGRKELTKRKDIYSAIFSLAIFGMGISLGTMESNEFSGFAFLSTFSLAGIFPFASRYLGVVDFSDLEDKAFVCDRYVRILKENFAL